VIVILTYPETAHRALEDLNPDDADLLPPTVAPPAAPAPIATAPP
jgi:hypothetical protein